MILNPRSSQIAWCIYQLSGPNYFGCIYFIFLGITESPSFPSKARSRKKARQKNSQIKFNWTCRVKEIIENCMKLLHIIISNDNIILKVIVKLIVYIIYTLYIWPEAILFLVISRENWQIFLWQDMFLSRKYIKGYIFAHSL